MLLDKVHPIIIVLFPAIVLAYDMSCPDHSHITLRSRGLCVMKSNTNFVYTCLEDVNTPKLTFYESCSEIEDAARPGKKLVFKGQSTVGECSAERYQPIPFYKSSGAMCLYLKSKCTDVGQVVARKDSGLTDTTCICDHTEGYAYVTRPRDVCNCVPLVEDCTCYEKLCPESHLLSAGYECIHRNVTSVKKCTAFDKSENNFTTTTTTTIRTDSTAFNESPTRVKNADYAATVMTVILILSVVIIGVLYFLINRDFEYFTQTMAKTIECIEGDNVELSCAVYDDNIPAHWSKNGIIIQQSAKYKIIDLGKSHILCIIQLNLHDAGEYSVTINNEVRSSSVQVKEYFNKELIAQTCTEGEDVHFECEVLDDNQTSQWYKDGIEVSTSDRYKVERHGKLHRLVVHNTKLPDKGEYSVRIKNCIRLCKLTVKEYFYKALATQTCNEGEDVQFECEVIDDNQIAHWFKDDNEVIPSEKYIMKMQGKVHRLVVKSTKCDDEGTYYVRIKNCVKRCKLTVKEYFTKALITQTCMEGEDVQFECEVLDDKQTALWFKDGTEVITSDRYKVERIGRLHRLIVNNAKPDDKGEYSVRIKNLTRWTNLIVQEIPTAIRQLSKEDKDIYLEIIKSGTETRYYIRIVIIGEHGVGKTCLLRRLLEESIDDVESTDGIDVVHRCKIRLKDGEYEEWIMDKDTNKRNDIITRIRNAKTLDNQQNQPGPSKGERQTQKEKKYVEEKIQSTKLSDLSTDGINKRKVTELSTYKQETELSTCSTDYQSKGMEKEKRKSFIESNQLKIAEKKIATRLENTLTMVILDELLHVVNIEKKSDTPTELLVDCGFWDFAGPRQYYPTHPIFLNPNAVYLLVADIMTAVKKKYTEGGYDQMGEYIEFWFDTIHSCRDVDDMENSTADHLNPPVIVVCTGIDKCEDKLNDRKKEFKQQLIVMLHNEDKQKHLREICCISNKKPSKEDLEYLRRSIFKLGKNAETYGERLPLRWIQLEQALDILCEAGINILSWTDMVHLASAFSIRDEHEVGLFLKYHHKIGSIIYFESLKDYIILNQKWLADAFKCFISDKYDIKLKLTKEWKTLEDTGELKPSLITKLFEKEPKHEFYKHEGHLLEVMEMFGIIFKLQTALEGGHKQTYYMPLLISQKTSIDQIYYVFGVKSDTCTRTPWLCIQFDFMPFDFFNHIFCHYVRKYSVCTETSSERKAIYLGMGVFYLDHTQYRKFILCFSKNTIAMQIWQWRKLEQGKCKSMLEELRSVIRDVENKCEPRKVFYTLRTKCAYGDIHITAGQCSYTELLNLGGKDYFCEEHNEMHDTSDFFHTWLEEYSENFKEHLEEKTQPVQGTNQTARITSDSIIHSEVTKIQDLSGCTPLMVACSRGNISDSRSLIAKGDNYNASDSKGQTVFYWSCVGGNIDIIDLLIAKGCDIDMPNIYGETPLMAACINRHLSSVQRLIKMGADCNAIDSRGQTVFYWSCVGGNIHIIDFLIAKKCDIYKANNYGKTPLMEACGKGYLSVVQLLTEQGADCHATDSSGRTVFYWSCAGGDVKIIHCLIEKGCDIYKSNNSGKTPLMEACAKGHLLLIKRLITMGADYNASDLSGKTVFLWSCVGGNIHIIDFLIGKNCDIHKSDNGGKTPLMEACAKGHLSAVQHLIKRGADYNASDSTGHTVFSWSCVGGNVQIIDLLIGIGCDILKPNKSEKTSLMAACGGGHLSAVQRLIEKGADYNASDSSGRTVFYWSCVGGNVNILDFLIAKGCDIHKFDNNGKTPLMAACAKGHLSAVQHLIQKGAEYNASDSTGCTVFHWSCVGGNVEVICFLITKGCDINKSDKSGKTPLMAACYKGHFSAVRLLIQNGADNNATDFTGHTVFYWSSVGGNADIMEYLINKGDS